MEENNKIDKEKLFQYTFYDNNRELNVVLDVEYLKKIFNADNILLNEKEHK